MKRGWRKRKKKRMHMSRGAGGVAGSSITQITITDIMSENAEELGGGASNFSQSCDQNSFVI